VAVEFLSHHEVLQVLVVCPDFHQVLGSFQEMPSLFQCIDDSKHLLVMDLVIPFHQRQGFAVEGHRVLSQKVTYLFCDELDIVSKSL